MKKKPDLDLSLYPKMPLYYAPDIVERSIDLQQKWENEQTRKNNVKFSKVPSYLLMAWDTWYARHHYVREIGKAINTGTTLTLLIEDGICRQCETPEFRRYRHLREQTLSDLDLDPSFKAGLRNWLKKCSWEPPIAYGSTESYTFKSSEQFHSFLCGRAVELGLTTYALGVAALANGLSELDIREDEREALTAISDSLVMEIGERAEALERKINGYRQRSKS